MIWRFAVLAGFGLCGVVEAAAQELPRIIEPAPAVQRYSAVGYASWYGNELRGHATADGENFDIGSLSAAHRTMPLPCYARVTNLGNGRSIVVRVNDRGPFIRGRILDVSARVANLLQFSGLGVAKVRIDYVGKAAPAGSDERALLASLRTGGAPATAEPAPLVARAAPEQGETVVARVLERPKTPEPAPLAVRAASGDGGTVVAPVLERPKTAEPTPLAVRAASDDGATVLARVLERPKAPEPRSPYGDLIMPALWAPAAQTTASASP